MYALPKTVLIESELDLDELELIDDLVDIELSDAELTAWIERITKANGGYDDESNV